LVDDQTTFLLPTADRLSLTMSVQRKCPSCGSLLPTERYRAGEPWVCPSCSAEWQLARWYSHIGGWGSLLVSLSLFFLLGLRGWQLLVATILMWLPVATLCTMLLNRIFPPPLERFGGKHDGGLSILR